MENSWNPRRGYFNRVGFGKLQCFNCSSAAKSIWEFQMGKDICVWKSKIFVRFVFLVFNCYSSVVFPSKEINFIIFSELCLYLDYKVLRLLQVWKRRCFNLQSSKILSEQKVVPKCTNMHILVPLLPGLRWFTLFLLCFLPLKDL